MASADALLLAADRLLERASSARAVAAELAELGHGGAALELEELAAVNVAAAGALEDLAGPALEDELDAELEAILGTS